DGHLAVGEQVFLPFAMAEVAERFAWLPLVAEVAEDVGQPGDDFLGRNHVLVDEAEAIALLATAEEDGVLPLRLADEADVAVVGACAAVRAAGHAGGEDLAPQAELGQGVL